MHRFYSCTLALASLGLLAACANTKSLQKTEPSEQDSRSFVYQKGEEDAQSLWYYEQPEIDWKRYRTVMIRPVRIEMNEDHQLSEEEITKIRDTFHQQLRDAARPYVKLVSTPYPHTLELQISLSNIKPSSPTGDTIASSVPFLLQVNRITEWVDGESFFTGSAIERVTFKDASSGQILRTSIDQRAGTFRLGGSLTKGFDSLRDIHHMTGYWAEQMFYDLCRKQTRPVCTEPEA